MSKLEQQYKQVEQAYEGMGLEIPADLEAVKTKLTKHQKETISKGKGQLIISPAITKDFTIFDLVVDALDKKQSEESWVYKPLWEQYDLTSPASINVINLTIGNEYGDPVVQYTNKTIEEQSKIKNLMNPTEAIMLQAIFRLDGKNLAPKTFIRFPQLGFKTVDGYSVVGVVYSLRGQFRLGWDRGYADSDDGVGLSVGQRIELQPSALPSTISSEAQAISLLKKAGYKVMKEF